MRPLHPLDISADLRLTSGGHTIHVKGEKAHVVVSLPSFRAGSALLRAGALPAVGSRGLLKAQELLRAAGLTVEVQLAGVPFAVLGCNARPGAMARLLRLRAVEVRTPPALRTALLTAGVALAAGGVLRWLKKC